MNKITYLLICLIEECAEVIHRACKAIRFGLEEVQPGQEWKNAYRLNDEMNDLAAVAEMLEEESVFFRPALVYRAGKKKKVNKFMDYSRDLSILKEDEMNCVTLTGEQIAELFDEHNIAINVVTDCPKCGLRHIDAPDPDNCKNCGHPEELHLNAGERNFCAFSSNQMESVHAEIECACDGFEPWLNGPHKKHRCSQCNHRWQPYAFNTNGVESLDLPEVSVAPASAGARQ